MFNKEAIEAYKEQVAYLRQELVRKDEIIQQFIATISKQNDALLNLYEAPNIEEERVEAVINAATILNEFDIPNEFDEAYRLPPLQDTTSG